MLKSLRPTNSSITKVKTSSGDKNRITSEAELKALLDEHRKTRVIGSDGEPITTLMDKRKVLSAESTATPDGLYSYLMAGSKMTYSMFIEDYLTLSDAKAPIGEQFEAALSLISTVGKAKKGKDALEALRDWEKGIEETYDLANNSKKAKDAKTTQKEIDQLGEYVKKHDKGTGNTLSVTSSLKQDPRLVKAAEQMGKDKAIQQEADELIQKFISGNTNPGLGSKNLFGNVSYLRGRNGARVFYRMNDGKMEILGKSNKKNEQTVINTLKELYGK